MTNTADTIRIAINAVHQRARVALDARNLELYLSFLHPRLLYIKTDGVTLGKQDIGRDVRRQFANAHVVRTSFRQQSFAVTSDGATEVLEQDIEFVVRAFGFVRREWNVTRRGRYDWIHDGEAWRIKRIEVASEKTSSRWYLAWPRALAT